MSPMFDDLTDLYNYEYSNGCLLRIFTSCILALGVNISNYLVLGKTSPLTYQVSPAKPLLQNVTYGEYLSMIGVRSYEDDIDLDIRIFILQCNHTLFLLHLFLICFLLLIIALSFSTRNKQISEI